MVYKSKRRAPKEQTSGAYTPNYKYPTFHTGGSKNNHFVQIGEALKDIDHRLGATGDAKVKVDNIVDATDLGKDILLSADTEDVRDILEVQTVAETKTAIDAAVTTEANTRTAEDARLQTAINTETAARTAADAALQTKIEEETATRTEADATLQTNIDNEAEAREAAVTAEADARTKADDKLTADIAAEVANRTKAVTDEQKAREIADQTEAATRENQDAAITAAINTEILDRKKADATLQTNIDLKADKTALPTKVSELQNDSDFQSGAQVDAKIAEATTMIYNYKGAVDTPDDLPAGSKQNPNKVGDTYNDKSTGMNYVWDGKAWDALGAVTTLATLGVTATAEELNYAKGVTSAIQTQIDSKLAADANAVSAAKLETARNIVLNGDVTGTVAFDGSADVTVNAVIASESVEPAMLLAATEEEKAAFRTAIAAASAADLATETTAREATDAAVAKETQDRTAAVKTVSDAIAKETEDRENSVVTLNASIDTKLAIADKPTADTLSGATDTGKAVLKAADAEAARTAIGAGTSSFSGSWNDLADKPALLKGDKGEQGDPGAAGPTGPAAGFGVPTVTVDNTVGTPSATVTAEGEDTAKIFNFAFTGIKGEKGDRGEAGERGPQGIQGPQGEPGAEYVLPAATKNALGGVKLIEFDNAIGEQAAHATIAEDATVDAAAFNSLVTDYNKLLAEFNNVISNMVAAGICTRP